MNYKEAIEYIENKSKLGIKPGLSSIKELLSALGNPQRRLKTVHIAGTNGKGSAGAFLESILLAAGIRTARYTSPAVFEYLERFTVCGEQVSEGEFAGIISQMAELPEAENATAFEIETAAAFCLFALKKVDIALIECGMGGLLDATNVDFDTQAAMLTSIGADHLAYLGPTLRDVAVNKAGIIKSGCITVTAPQTAEVMEAIKERCSEVSSELITVSEDDLIPLSFDLEEGTRFTYKKEEYLIMLPGSYQPENAVLAIETANALKKLGFAIRREDITEGLKKAGWRGRMEVVRKNPLLIFDGAHNEPAWKKLVQSVDFYFTNRRIIYIIGVFKDKDYDRLVELIAGMHNTQTVICITAPGARGLDRDILFERFEKAGVHALKADGVMAAVELAGELAGPEDVTICCGSLSYFKEANLSHEKSK